MGLLDDEIVINLQLIDELGFKDTLNLNLRQTAKVIGVTAPTIDNRRKQGFIEALVVGGRILYPKIKIAEFQARKKLELLEDAKEAD